MYGQTYWYIIVLCIYIYMYVFHVYTLIHHLFWAKSRCATDDPSLSKLQNDKVIGPNPTCLKTTTRSLSWPILDALQDWHYLLLLFDIPVDSKKKYPLLNPSSCSLLVHPCLLQGGSINAEDLTCSGTVNGEEMGILSGTHHAIKIYMNNYTWIYVRYG